MTYKKAQDIYNHLSRLKLALIQKTLERIKEGPPYEKFTESEMSVYGSFTEDERTVFYYIAGLTVSDPSKYNLQDQMFMELLNQNRS
jgi:hypothetical protein